MNGKEIKGNNMFTAGCCILCLSARKWLCDKVKERVFQYVVLKSARQLNEHI